MRAFRIAWLSAALAAAPLLPTGIHAGSVPEANGPVCVPYPGMPCPGDATDGGSSGGSGRSAPASGGSGSRSHKTSNETLILQGLKDTLNQMSVPNPAALQKIHETRLEGDRALQESVQAQQMTEEQRRQKAVRDAEDARLRQVRDLAGSLQGLPGTPTDERLRDWAGSGFDTGGKLGGNPVLPAPPAPPPPTPVAPVAPVEKPIPPEKMTPEMQSLVQERQAVREKKAELQRNLEQLETGGKAAPADSAEIARLKEELAVTLNKENYLTFSVNEALESPSAPKP
jgi:hypothetical protein